jgi:hypothetical protein
MKLDKRVVMIGGGVRLSKLRVFLKDFFERRILSLTDLGHHAVCMNDNPVLFWYCNGGSVDDNFFRDSDARVFSNSPKASVLTTLFLRIAEVSILLNFGTTHSRAVVSNENGGWLNLNVDGLDLNL